MPGATRPNRKETIRGRRRRNFLLDGAGAQEEERLDLAEDGAEDLDVLPAFGDPPSLVILQQLAQEVLLHGRRQRGVVGFGVGGGPGRSSCGIRPWRTGDRGSITGLAALGLVGKGEAAERLHVAGGLLEGVAVEADRLFPHLVPAARPRPGGRSPHPRPRAVEEKDPERFPRGGLPWGAARRFSPERSEASRRSGAPSGSSGRRSCGRKRPRRGCPPTGGPW